MARQLTLAGCDEPGDTIPSSLGPGATLLRGFALPHQHDLLDDLARVVAGAPFRHMLTPGGFRMSAAMTNCGDLGWVSDEGGYRYDAVDPVSGLSWPALPASFVRLAASAGAIAGFAEVVPDACLRTPPPGTASTARSSR